MERKEKLVNGGVYHILTKSIAGYNVFNKDNDYQRILDVIKYYQNKDVTLSYSKYYNLTNQFKESIDEQLYSPPRKLIVQIIAFCLMPTHIHLILKQLADNGISIFMRNILNSYSHYFNLLHQRKGPLWEGKFKNILVENDNQLLHLTRYIHLNPSSAGLVKNPQDWKYSSYNEYIGANEQSSKIADYNEILDIRPGYYKQFVEERKDYQKLISKIKKVLLENYHG
ncbi:MAG: hypothetical protein CEN88_434 [Candidatus Berkelbacteria bacterium Licking1014_2]|uniref:Transposase IS200-like domain-containing protein n=1 Tax=Candidatus Berkelbacteria bacterium Licking1014_2 TaxID=2017146 RepID=A0A554LSB7_9BACT|nr:MAG: hypothetical protein CEN88_434 [Candidatus Berkelbacteria bacterium Licking1014_2]